MKAVLCPSYGPPTVIRLGEMPDPVPGPGEAVMRVKAAAVSTADWRIRSLDVPAGFGLMIRAVFGWRRPRQPVLGDDAAGVIEAVGPGVTRVAPGDRVIAATGGTMGCHAERVLLTRRAMIVPVPEELSWDEAAALPFGGLAALHFLRAARALEPGCRVLVIGAAGAVGSAAVQIAADAGAHVTALASTPNRDFVTGLGAAEVIDRTTRRFDEGGARFDVILDCVGATGWAAARPALARGGRLVLVSASLPEMLSSLLPRAGGRRLISGYVAGSQADLETLAGMAAEGRLVPVVERSFPPEAAVAAHVRVETRAKRGAVVLHFG